MATPTPPTSRRPDAAPEKPHLRHRNPAGCLSGILRLFTRHRFSHHRKRLPSGDRNRRFSGEVAGGEEHRRDGSGTYLLIPEKSAPPALPDSWLRSCDSLRSPTIQQEIRRSGAAAAVESPRRPLSTVVARLMGIGDAAAATEAPSPRIEHCSSSSSPESATEKRRKLLGALKQCDEDLKVLRRIINAVQGAEEARRTEAARSSAARLLEIEAGGGHPAAATPPEQQALPSPVSVLDAVIFHGFGGGNRRLSEKQQRKKPPPIAVRSTVEHRPPAAAAMSNGGECRRRPASSSRMNSASAADGVAGGILAKEELGGELDGGVGICVEEGIFRELVGEVVLELMMSAAKSCRRYPYIGAGTCRKRLRF